MRDKFLYGIALVIIFTSCSQSDKSTDSHVNDIETIPQTIQKGTVESIAKQYINAQLTIPSSEKYELEIYKEQLNNDNNLDAIVTVNRLEFALNEAASSSKTAKMAEIGFMGNYNYLFFYDGKSKQITSQILVASSPYSPLKINFENITSPHYKDVLVDFRVLNASFRDFYTINNLSLIKIFEWKNFDGLGGGKTEAFHFEYDKGTLSNRKDILVKKATYTQPKNIKDIYTFEPTLIYSNELAFRFFYHPETDKYMTRK